LKITEEWQKKNPDSAVYARDLVVCYFKLKRINDLKEALIYMINKNMHMDPQLVEVCRQLGIPIKMGASNLVEIIENEYTGDKRLEAADKCFQEQKWKEAEQLFLNLLMQNIVAKNLQYKIAVCILNGNEKLPDDQRNRVVNLIKQMKGLGKIIEADEIEQLLSKKNLD